jgi:hypothetical protein
MELLQKQSFCGTRELTLVSAGRTEPSSRSADVPIEYLYRDTSAQASSRADSRLLVRQGSREGARRRSLRYYFLVTTRQKIVNRGNDGETNNDRSARIQSVKHIVEPLPVLERAWNSVLMIDW